MDRGVRLVFESLRPVAQVAADLGVHPEALRKRVRQAEGDSRHRGCHQSTSTRLAFAARARDPCRRAITLDEAAC